MGAIAARRYTWKLMVQKYKALIVEALSVKSKQNVGYSTAELSYNQLLEMNMGHLKNQEAFYTKR